MSIVQAYQSDTDGKLFLQKSNYIQHLRKLASVRRHSRLMARLEQEREAFFDRMGQVKSIADLELFIQSNWRWFWLNGAKNTSWRYGNGQAPDFHEYVEVSLHHMYWNECVSNSHSCPRQGVENFDRRSERNQGKPTGYPGWHGGIEIRVRPPVRKSRGKEYLDDGWGSDYFGKTPICTGGGGGGGRNDTEYVSYGYDLKLFAADFPVMYLKYRQAQWLAEENDRRARAWRTLGGKTLPAPVTELPPNWTCPDPMTCHPLGYDYR
jgi:hypothetical protein